MSETHQKVGEIDAPTEEGSLPLTEYKCHNSSNFTVVPAVAGS